MKKNYLFLLGGHDLEMQTIKAILLSNGYDPVHILDGGLSWNNADIQHYLDQISTRVHAYDVIYGIELRNKSKLLLPDNYRLIDHHNESSDLPSSLEQIAEIIGVELSACEKLIAANDRGYIPALLKAGAKQEQINEIRRLDRKAQGITEEDENTAEKAIAEMTKIGTLKIVRAANLKSSPVCDRLYPDYEHLIVRSDNDLTYYGSYVPELIEKYQTELKEGSVYYGGENKSFFGVSQRANKELLEQVFDYIVKPSYSTHIFLLPLTFQLKKNMRETVSWIKKNLDNSDFWEPSYVSYEAAFAEAFTMQAYFYEHVSDAMFEENPSGNSRKHNALSVYKYCGVKSNSFYEIGIKIKDKPCEYKLLLEKITLNIYCSGICILAIHCKNKDYPELQDVMNINEYGRRIYPQFLGASREGLLQNARNAFLAEKISLINTLGNDPLSDDFTRYNEYKSDEISQFKLPDYLFNLFPESLRKKNQIHWLIDDRMFVICWHGNDSFSKKIMGADRRKGRYNYQTNKHVYEYIFVDKYGGCTCQCDSMLEESILESTNPRWIGEGTLFGITNYSFVALTDTKNYSGIIRTHVNTLYYYMMCLVLAQRATVLELTKQVYQTSKNTSRKKIFRLNENYSECLNKMFFSEVTAQQQGDELYRLAQNQIQLERHRKNLETEIDRIYNHIGVVHSHRLNIIAAVFAPFAVTLAFMGINDPTMVSHTFHQSCWWITCSIFLCIFGVVSLVIYKWEKIKRLFNA